MAVSLTYRALKGSALTADEVDANFQALEDEIGGLQGASLVGEGIGSIVVNFDIMDITGSAGSDFGSHNLPVPHGKGDWISSVNYVALDMVMDDGNGYICKVAHLSGLSFAADLAFGYWEKIVSRGDNAVSVNWLGNYDALTNYLQGDGVSYNGDLFVALESILGVAPSDLTKWRRLGPADGGGVSEGAALFLAAILR